MVAKPLPIVLLALALAWGVMLLFGGTGFDRGLLVLLYAGERPDLASAARLTTMAGDWEVLLALTAAGAIWLLLWRRDWRDAVLLVALTISGRLVVAVQKDWTERLRPDAHEHLVPVQSLAFPSGHAANATLVFLALALLLPRPGWTRIAAVWAAAWAALAVGVSRVVLGVHWPSDVIGGWAFGLFWTILVLRLAGHELDDGTEAASRSFSPVKE